jgi:ATP-dependent helicase Lhr and Lhr-like helicase
MMLCFDVLLQFLSTLAVGRVSSCRNIPHHKNTFGFQDIQPEEWQALLHHLTEGGTALKQYDEFKKVEIEPGFTR